MNEAENFESLRKLLKLKRYEQPPPGYFDRLPGQIMARIEREPQASWWERVVSALTLKPAFAYSLGLGFCVVLVGAVFYGINLQDESAVPPALVVQPWKAPAGPALVSQTAPVFQPAQRQDLASTNPVTPPQAPSLFEGIQVQVAPVSYGPGN